MSRREHLLACSFLLCGALIFSNPANGATGQNAKNSCVHCHFQLPDTSFVGVKSHNWKGSMHQAHGVTCDKCHGGNSQALEKRNAHLGVLDSSHPQSLVYFKNVPSTCGKCHGAEFYKFSQSLHFKILESTGKGPDCVTCHGSMVTGVLTPDTIAAVCERCHNEKMGVSPYIPLKAKAVLLLMRVSKALLEADQKLYHPAEGTPEARSLSDAGAALHSAGLDWHKFDLDTITGHLQDIYNALQRLPPKEDLLKK